MGWNHQPVFFAAQPFHSKSVAWWGALVSFVLRKLVGTVRRDARLAGGFAIEETRNEKFLYEMDVQGIFVTKNETVFGEYLWFEATFWEMFTIN